MIVLIWIHLTTTKNIQKYSKQISKFKGHHESNRFYLIEREKRLALMIYNYDYENLIIFFSEWTRIRSNGHCNDSLNCPFNQNPISTFIVHYSTT